MGKFHAGTKVRSLNIIGVQARGKEGKLRFLIPRSSGESDAKAWTRVSPLPTQLWSLDSRPRLATCGQRPLPSAEQSFEGQGPKVRLSVERGCVAGRITDVQTQH